MVPMKQPISASVMLSGVSAWAKPSRRKPMVCKAKS